jgi:hypothetical protein
MIIDLIMKLRKIAIFLLIALPLAYCERYEYIGTVPEPPSETNADTSYSEYRELEKTIRERYDHYAVFTWVQYKQFLEIISQEKFLVLPLNEMRNTYSNTKVVIGLRHDVDFNVFKALEMANIEKKYGIRATYYLLTTAEYYGRITNLGLVKSHGIGTVIKKIYQTGAEIGIHNDLLTVMIQFNLEPFQFNQEELEFYKSLGIPVYGTAAHGSPIAKQTVPNYQIFSDFAQSETVRYLGHEYPLGLHNLKEYGFQYESYFIDFKTYFSESGGRWNHNDGFKGILENLKSSKPGDRIQILAHPDWWGKKL